VIVFDHVVLSVTLGHLLRSCEWSSFDRVMLILIYGHLTFKVGLLNAWLDVTFMHFFYFCEAFRRGFL